MGVLYAQLNKPIYILSSVWDILYSFFDEEKDVRNEELVLWDEELRTSQLYVLWAV